MHLFFSVDVDPRKPIDLNITANGVRHANLPVLMAKGAGSLPLLAGRNRSMVDFPFSNAGGEVLLP